MTFLLILICILLVAAGIVFSVIPPLPGPVLSYGAILISHYFIDEVQFAGWALIVWAVLVTMVTILDYALPILATKKFGGTKWGIWGGMIGLIIGFILPIPFGIVIGPLLGAIIGDLIGGNHIKAAVRSGFGSFIGFVTATSIKVLLTLIIGVILSYRIGLLGIDLIKEHL